MQNDNLEISTDLLPQTPWYKTKPFKIGMVVISITAVIAVVLFSKQIGELLNLFGTKAATEERSIVIDGVGLGDDTHFFEGGYTIDPSDSFRIDPNTNRLMLN